MQTHVKDGTQNVEATQPPLNTRTTTGHKQGPATKSTSVCFSKKKRQHLNKNAKLKKRPDDENRYVCVS